MYSLSGRRVRHQLISHPNRSSIPSRRGSCCLQLELVRRDIAGRSRDDYGNRLHLAEGKIIKSIASKWRLSETSSRQTYCELCAARKCQPPIPNSCHFPILLAGPLEDFFSVGRNYRCTMTALIPVDGAFVLLPNPLSRKTSSRQEGRSMAGICAAITSARNGAKTVPVLERPVLRGADVDLRRARTQRQRASILEEIELENCYRNAFVNYSIWDSILSEKVSLRPNLTLHLNASWRGPSLPDHGYPHERIFNRTRCSGSSGQPALRRRRPVSGLRCSDAYRR